MKSLFDKLNLGSQRVIQVLNAPRSFEPQLAALEAVTVKRTLTGTSSFAMAFVITQAQLDSASHKVAAACQGDAVVWMVYPKATSKKYRCEFNRDCGWAALGAAGFEPVRMVAVDEDWSALRFRRAEYIKTMGRSREHSISTAGKRKTTGRRK